MSYNYMFRGNFTIFEQFIIPDIVCCSPFLTGRVLKRKRHGKGKRGIHGNRLQSSSSAVSVCLCPVSILTKYT